MIFRFILSALLLIASTSSIYVASTSSIYAYVFDVDWQDYTSMNYGRGHLVAVNVWLAICESQSVTLSVDRQTILNSSGYSGNITATHSGNAIAFNSPYTNDRITKKLVLWPIQQDGNVFKCAYYFISYGWINRSFIPGTENMPEAFIWSDFGECNITNIFAGDISVQLLNHNNHFPVTIYQGVINWMNPGVRDIDVFYDSLRTNLNEGRIRPGSVSELRYAYQGFQSVVAGNTTVRLTHTRDFITWQYYDFSSPPGIFATLLNTSSSSSELYNNFLLYDTDSGSEPDLHEFYALHLYTYPEDDWTYSGENYPSGGGSGSGSGGEVTGFSQGAQGAITGATENALENYFGSSAEVEAPVLESQEYDEDLEDLDFNDDWLSDTLEGGAFGGSSGSGQGVGIDTIMPDGVGTFKSLVNEMKTSDSSQLADIEIPLAVDLSGFGQGVAFANQKARISFLFLLEPPFATYWNILRWIAVLCMYAALIIHIMKDCMLLGGNSATGGGE